MVKQEVNVLHWGYNLSTEYLNFLKDNKYLKFIYYTNMDTISSITNGISSKTGINGISAFDLSDTTFADLLQKEIDSKKDDSLSNIFTSFGVPVDFQIQEVNLDNISNQAIKSISPTDKKQENENMLQFAKKQATQFYNKYSGSVVTDLEEFVSDALNIN